MLTNLIATRRDWITVGLCVVAIPLSFVPPDHSLGWSLMLLGGLWAWIADWHSQRLRFMRNTIPEIYTAIRSGAMPSRTPLARILMAGAKLSLLTALAYYVALWTRP